MHQDSPFCECSAAECADQRHQPGWTAAKGWARQNAPRRAKSECNQICPGITAAWHNLRETSSANDESQSPFALAESSQTGNGTIGLKCRDRWQVSAHTCVELSGTCKLVQADAVVLEVSVQQQQVKNGCCQLKSGQGGTSSCSLNNVLKQQLCGLCIHPRTSQAPTLKQLFEHRQQRRGLAPAVSSKLSHSTATAAAHNPALIRRDTGTYDPSIQILIALSSRKLLWAFERKPHFLIQRSQGRPNCHGANGPCCPRAGPHITSWVRNIISLHFVAQDSSGDLPPGLYQPN